MLEHQGAEIHGPMTLPSDGKIGGATLRSYTSKVI
jgi:hypothetical protein